MCRHYFDHVISLYCTTYTHPYAVYEFYSLRFNQIVWCKDLLFPFHTYRNILCTSIYVYKTYNVPFVLNISMGSIGINFLLSSCYYSRVLRNLFRRTLITQKRNVLRRTAQQLTVTQSTVMLTTVILSRKYSTYLISVLLVRAACSILKIS